MKIRLLYFSILFFSLFSGTASVVAQSNEKDIILIVASYNPDTKRMSSFTTSFEDEILKRNLSCQVRIEDMGCKGIDEAIEWQKRINNIITRYNGLPLKAVILLGQEAFVSWLMQESLPSNIPMFACFVSENGIKLPTTGITDLSKWEPKSINMAEWARDRGIFGGIINVYDINKNISLIRSLYPKTQNIAFVSDNTYGGISLQALVKKEIRENHPSLNLILIDTHKEEATTAVKKISSLPSNTALLIGTWRVDKNGEYFLSSNYNDLFLSNSSIPVFSISGTGIGNMAIGGYIPNYDKDNASIIAQQISDFYHGKVDSVQFKSTGNKYLFDREGLKRAGIKDYQLPPDSKFIDNAEEKLKKYQTYIYVGSFILIITVFILVVLYGLLYRNKRLQQALIKREKELIEARDRAEESDKLKSAFLANMSHEIRTPLNAIVGFSALLVDDTLSSEDKKMYTSIIENNSELLLTLINDILEVSRLETGRISFSYQKENIDDLCKHVMSTTSHLHKEGIEYIYTPTNETFDLNTDRQRIMQVLINLMTNANKFTEKGTITLSFEVQKEQNRVLFSVTDTGCGIPQEARDSIFNRFRKLNEHKQGTGLGLSICQHIAKIFGGEIWVDREYTDGARFIFSHPINIDKQGKSSSDFSL